MNEHKPGGGPPDGTTKPVPPNARIDYTHLDNRERERHRHDAAGASRGIAALLLAGGR